VEQYNIKSTTNYRQAMEEKNLNAKQQKKRSNYDGDNLYKIGDGV
jgi:hypothetical protein